SGAVRHFVSVQKPRFLASSQLRRLDSHGLTDSGNPPESISTFRSIWPSLSESAETNDIAEAVAHPSSRRAASELSLLGAGGHADWTRSMICAIEPEKIGASLYGAVANELF